MQRTIPSPAAAQDRPTGGRPNMGAQLSQTNGIACQCIAAIGLPRS